MPAQIPTPTKVEQRYLEVVAQMRRERVPFSHTEMRDRMGWRSITSAWNVFHQLVRKGYMVEQGAQLALIRVPAPTKKALAHLRAKAA